MQRILNFTDSEYHDLLEFYHVACREMNGNLKIPTILNKMGKVINESSSIDLRKAKKIEELKKLSAECDEVIAKFSLTR